MISANAPESIRGIHGYQIQKICKEEVENMSEYIISYRAGDSPYWYNVSTYALREDEAMAWFVNSPACPYNVREVRVKKI